jgi:acetolactate synthase small subunit
MVEFITKWQTLVGSALGPFLAVILSAFGFLIKSWIESGKERKEFLRRIEISITQSLDSTYKMRQQLRQIVQRIKILAITARDLTDSKTFCLNRVNFPPVREVYRDKEAPYFKVKSYYLHNKLLWIDSGIKEVNEININFKNDFADLIRQNELLVALIKENQNPDPLVQKIAYAENLENFASVIEEYINNHISQGIELMTQIKIYNEHLRQKDGSWFLWKHEGIKYKYFRNKIEQKNFSRNLDSLARIDKTIQKEVETAVKDAEERAIKLAQ